MFCGSRGCRSQASLGTSSPFFPREGRAGPDRSLGPTSQAGPSQGCAPALLQGRGRRHRLWLPRGAPGSQGAPHGPWPMARAVASLVLGMEVQCGDATGRKGWSGRAWAWTGLRRGAIANAARGATLLFPQPRLLRDAVATHKQCLDPPNCKYV
ncbi:unnamed protein product [Coccothraustes coccothraustes]